MEALIEQDKPPPLKSSSSSKTAANGSIFSFLIPSSELKQDILENAIITIFPWTRPERNNTEFGREKIPGEVKLLKKEYFNRWHGLTSYYMALTISRLPIQIVASLIFLTLVYFLTGMPFQVLRFCLFSLVGILVSFVADGLGMSIGSVFSQINGCAMGPSTVTPALVLAIYGFDFARKIPWWVNMIQRISYMRCGTVALIVTLFSLQREPLSCTDIYCHYSDPLEVALRVTHSSLMSSDRMKPRSGDWAIEYYIRGHIQVPIRANLLQPSVEGKTPASSRIEDHIDHEVRGVGYTAILDRMTHFDDNYKV
uniref:ABC-2 type transporter transmembrane domain-containing protein n=1 Tax=Timema poppense TaxID=170557 RepID=A0A7R9CUS7_TIMPO|nr:unnamed protein product [Timema poppensis]